MENRIKFLNTVCNCRNFGEDLFKLFMDIDLSEQHMQWKKLEIFLKEHSCYVYEANNDFPKQCSQMLCAMLLKELTNQDKWNIIIRIFDIMSHIYFTEVPKDFDESFVSYCGLKFLCSGRSLKKLNCNWLELIRTLIALEGNSHYMKILVNLDLLSRPNNKSQSVFKAALHVVLFEFMQSVANISYHEYDDGDGFHDDDHIDYGDDIEDDDEEFVDDDEDIEDDNEVIHHDEVIDYDEDLLPCFKYKAIVNTARYLFFRENHYDSLKRIYLTMIAIRAAYYKLRKEENLAKECLYCLRMYFIFTRDPVITINEVRIMLYASLNVLEKLQLFEPLYEEFIKMMPGCSSKLEPRSLTDLARCQIRENIKKCNRHLPEAVVQLNLAQPLKDFVLGDVIQMSRIKRNVFQECIITKSKLEDLVLQSVISELPPQFRTE